MSGCVYCGFPLDGGKKSACAKHADLLEIERELGSRECVCGTRMRGVEVEQGCCHRCWWLSRGFTDRELWQMAVAFSSFEVPEAPGR